MVGAYWTLPVFRYSDIRRISASVSCIVPTCLHNADTPALTINFCSLSYILTYCNVSVYVCICWAIVVYDHNAENENNMYEYIHIYMHTYIHTHIYIHIHMRVRACVRACVRVCVCGRVCVCFSSVLLLTVKSMVSLLCVSLLFVLLLLLIFATIP